MYCGGYDVKKTYNEILNQIERKRIITVAGRPAIGKTTFTVALLEEAVKKRNAEVMYFSLAKNEDNFRNSFNLTNDSIKIVDTATTIDEIENMCMRIESEKNLDIIALDYLQLVELKNVGISAKDHFGIVLDRLLKLSNELNITIIIISQLCRDVDVRNEHKPELKDIKKFGLLDEKSDMVVFLYPDRDDKLIITLAKQKLS